MARDYMTWWRKDLNFWLRFMQENSVSLLFADNLTANDWDCIAEQLWAHDQGLA